MLYLSGHPCFLSVAGQYENELAGTSNLHKIINSEPVVCFIFCQFFVVASRNKLVLFVVSKMFFWLLKFSKTTNFTISAVFPSRGVANVGCLSWSEDICKRRVPACSRSTAWRYDREIKEITKIQRNVTLTVVYHLSRALFMSLQVDLMWAGACGKII